MMSEGRHKFKTWWGAFFSLLVIALVLYFSVMKITFLIENRSTYFIETHHIDQGGLMQSFNDLNTEIDIEFTLDPSIEEEYYDEKIQSF